VKEVVVTRFRINCKVSDRGTFMINCAGSDLGTF
jgi:hypothetical protein